MSASYERMNTITSFGFSNRWRRQCVRELGLKPGQVVVDLMAGMGETWDYICERIGTEGTIVSVDFCEQMLQYADRKRKRTSFALYNTKLIQQDVLAGTLPVQSADHIVIAVGLKTFNERQISLLAREVQCMLKPGGQFSCIEVSVPEPVVPRTLYLFYLQYAIPVLGALFLGNPETYRVLGTYTVQFKNCQRTEKLFADEGLQCRLTSHFWGCASGIAGFNPPLAS
ncbi:class I SAM-dependent methyltransferase [Fibrella sp. USSR17]